VGDITPLGPGSGTGTGGGDGTGTGTGTGNGNNGGGSDAGSGGSVGAFAAIQMDIDSLGCSGTSCHGSGLKPSVKAGDAAGSYPGFVVDAMNGADSLVLTKNLMGSQITHSIKPFASTNDPVYQRWLAWITAGSQM
jgi:hypothetical protein